MIFLVNDQNEQIAERIMAAINARDLGQVDELTTQDVQLRFPPGQVFYGREGLREFLGQLQRRLPELTIAATRILTADSFAVVEYESRARTRPGSDVEEMGAMVLQLKEGRVCSVHLYLDTAQWERIAQESV